MVIDVGMNGLALLRWQHNKAMIVILLVNFALVEQLKNVRVHNNKNRFLLQTSSHPPYFSNYFPLEIKQ